MERHQIPRRIARSMYNVPGVRSTARVVTRFMIQNAPLSLKNKQRLYNFFAKDTAASTAIKFKCVIGESSKKTLHLELDIKDDLSNEWYYWGYSNYERGSVRLFCELLKSKSCVFDIGANIGFYSLLAGFMVQGRGEVYAFEPHPEVFRCLSYNSNLNDFKTLRLNQMAMSDVDGMEPLFLPADLAWTNASLIEGFTEQQAPIMIDVVRFDSYCYRYSIGPVDLIKVDVEGAELKVFKGMGELLLKWLPDIICEVLQPYEEELDEFFLRKDYRKFLITDNGLKEVERIKAHSQFRDYYLSLSPLLPERF